MNKLVWFFLFTVAACSDTAPSGSVPGPEVVSEGFVPMSDGVRLYYHQVGAGPQTVIIPGDLFLFASLQPRGPDRTLVYYDMRNRGRSDRVSDTTRITIQQDVADLEELRRHFGPERVSLVGYSYLGLMVALYALDHPDRVERVVQLGPVPLRYATEYPAELTAPPPVLPDSVEALRLRLERLRAEGYHRAHPEEFCELSWTVSRHGLVGDPANVTKTGPSRCTMQNEWPINLDRHFQYHFTSVQRLVVDDARLNALTVPFLTIHGTSDRNAPYGGGREWATLLPNARLLTIRGAAHSAWIDAPDVVLPAVATFLAGEWPTDAESVRRR